MMMRMPLGWAIRNSSRKSTVVVGSPFWNQATIRAATLPARDERYNEAASVAHNELDPHWDHREDAVFKPWPVPVIESKGGFRDEVWLEKYVGGPLYANQDKLPMAPVVSVEQTLNHFLPSALPLTRSDSEREALVRAVQSFPEQARHLQQRLEQQANSGEPGMLSDKNECDMSYYHARDPLMINVSPFSRIINDPTLLEEHPHPAHPSPLIRRAATVLTSTAEFRRLVCSGELPPDVLGRKPKQAVCCSAPYKYMFHACRIPALEKDSNRIYDPAQHHHAVIAVKGHYYSIDLADPTTGHPYSIHQLEDALHECVALATMAGPSLGLGWCASGNRDDWAMARARLLQVGGIDMFRALMRLESGAVLVCLDVDTTPSTITAMSKNAMHGSTSQSSDATGGNRWYDKSIQWIVTADGQLGGVADHSMLDGMSVARYVDHVGKTTYSSVVMASTDDFSSSSSTNGRPKVQAVFSKELRDSVFSTAMPFVNKAKEDFDKLVFQSSLRIEPFHGYGKSLLKKHGYSPDAYVQMAIQLATYRLWGEQAGTYAPAQVRHFLHGRTDTCRGVSIESAAFVQKMGAHPSYDNVDPETQKEKLVLLQKAVKAHGRITKLANLGQGVDSHFTALSVASKDGEKLPDLFSDPVFQRSKRWRVNSSNVSLDTWLGFGYGPVVPDGVSIAYSIHARHLDFNVAALKATGWADQLAHHLVEALVEMRELIESEPLPPATAGKV